MTSNLLGSIKRQLIRFTLVNFVFIFLTIVKGFYHSKPLSVTSTNDCESIYSEINRAKNTMKKTFIWYLECCRLLESCYFEMSSTSPARKKYLSLINGYYYWD